MNAVVGELIAIGSQLLDPLPVCVALALPAAVITGAAARTIAFIENLSVTRSES